MIQKNKINRNLKQTVKLIKEIHNELTEEQEELIEICLNGCLKLDSDAIMYKIRDHQIKWDVK